MVLPFIVATFLCLGILWAVSHASTALAILLGTFFFFIYVVGACCAWYAGSFSTKEDHDDEGDQSGDEVLKGD
jgi:ABC-type transport system involved in cytochrome bd biosynthesis fused ATPase/permease subunit